MFKSQAIPRTGKVAIVSRVENDGRNSDVLPRQILLQMATRSQVVSSHEIFSGRYA